MFADAVEKIENSFFPIFSKIPQERGFRLGVRGTGFFVNDKGLFVTACHVITNAPPHSQLFYTGNVPKKVIQFVEIKEVYKNASKDIYIVKLKVNFYQKLNCRNRNQK